MGTDKKKDISLEVEEVGDVEEKKKGKILPPDLANRPADPTLKEPTKEELQAAAVKNPCIIIITIPGGSRIIGNVTHESREQITLDQALMINVDPRTNQISMTRFEVPKVSIMYPTNVLKRTIPKSESLMGDYESARLKLYHNILIAKPSDAPLIHRP